MPVVFDTSYFCQFHCSVHSTLLDFRFRTRPLRSLFLAESDDDEPETSGQPEADFFFADMDGNLPRQVDPEKLDRLSDEYVKILIKMHD
jgi:hypothetical protein